MRVDYGLSGPTMGFIALHWHCDLLPGSGHLSIPDRAAKRSVTEQASSVAPDRDIQSSARRQFNEVAKMFWERGRDGQRPYP